MDPRKIPDSNPTPPSTNSNPRSRRAQNSSSEDSESDFDIYNVDYRVRTPDLPVLPTVRNDPGPFKIPAIDDARQDLIEMARDRVRRAGIELWNPSEDPDTRGSSEHESSWSTEYDEDRVELVKRHSPSRIYADGITLLIPAVWQGEHSKVVWQDCVKSIKLAANSLLPHNPIAVEMIAPELVKDVHLGCYPENPQLHAEWPIVKDMVIDLLEKCSHTKGMMTSIHLFRHGFSRDDAKNPHTIYISFDNECDETSWSIVKSFIRPQLPPGDWEDVKIHMEHGGAESFGNWEFVEPFGAADDLPYPSNLVNDEPYETHVSIGASISAAKCIPRWDGSGKGTGKAGSLGCFVEVKTRDSPNKWTKLALTNHHVVRYCFDGIRMSKRPGGNPQEDKPEISSQVHAADANGYFNLKDPPAHNILISNPAFVVQNHTIASLKQTLDLAASDADSSDEVKELNETLTSKLNFFKGDKHLLGHVVASSGFRRRTSNDGRLDWALVKVMEHRQGQNRVFPKRLDWLRKYSSQSRHMHLREGVAGHPLRLHDDAWDKIIRPGASIPVFKYGWRTRHTIGEYIREESAVKHVDDKYMSPAPSREYGFFGLSTGNYADFRFGDTGDSGSVVFDRGGHVVGLLFRGQKVRFAAKTLTFITPIGDVFKDIIDMAAGDILDIRVAQI